MSTAGAPFVSVVIPVRDDAEGAQLCVAALGDQTYPAERYEVVLVDDGSADSLRLSDIPSAAARVVHQPRSGSYAARNAGIDQAAGEIIAFTDSDCLPSPDW